MSATILAFPQRAIVRRPAAEHSEPERKFVSWDARPDEEILADADALFDLLEEMHGASGGEFAIPAYRWARDDVIPGWTEEDFTSARCCLVKQRRLVKTHQGGQRAGDCNLYVFAPQARREDGAA